MKKLFRDYQDETINNYILICEVIFFLLASTFIIKFSNITFANYFDNPLLVVSNFLIIFTLIILWVLTYNRIANLAFTWVFELFISIIYLVLVFRFLKFEFQFLYKLTLIMPVIVISLKYGLKMAFVATALSSVTVLFLSYQRSFSTINADIILIGILFLLAWLLGQMTETQYEIRSNLQLEVASRKRAEKEIKKQLGFLQNLIDTIPNPIFYTNLDLSFTGCNKAFTDFFGIPQEELLRKTIWDVFPPDPCEKICCILNKPQDSELLKLELTLTNHKGSLREVILNNAVIFDTENKALSLLGILIDITEERQFQKEMARVDKLNLICEMAAGIAHEIRNPITTVKGFLQLYQMKPNNDTIQENAQLMIEELDRANSIITEYLSLAKNQTLNLTSKNLNHIILSIAPLLEADASILEKNLKLDLKDDIPDSLFDEAQIRQLLLNICHNGLEAMEAGGTLTIRTYLQDAQIVLEINDQGKGISKDIQDKIGTPFVTDKENGTGLGLAVCYSIASRHNASITFDTGPKGTTFYIRFRT